MDEAAIKLEMRLAAIEHLLTDVYVQLLVLTRQSTEVLEQAIDRYAEEAGRQKFPGLDPAQSDLASAEFEDAVRNLQALQKQSWRRSERSEKCVSEISAGDGHRVTRNAALRCV
jgi:hypothetical protein